MAYGVAHILHVSAEGLVKLLEDVHAAEVASNTARSDAPATPVSVHPSPPGQKIRVELNEHVYKRLLNHELAARYQ